MFVPFRTGHLATDSRREADETREINMRTALAEGSFESGTHSNRFIRARVSSPVVLVNEFTCFRARLGSVVTVCGMHCLIACRETAHRALG